MAGLAQPCPPNIDFENGNFNNWQTYSGTVKAVGTTNTITVNPVAPAANRHTIITAATTPATDPYGGFPVLCPNGSGTSVRLGNNSVGAQAERISYTFTVPVTSFGYSLVYQYAVVLQDPDHQPFEQPRFTAKVWDVAAGQYLPCVSFEYVATSNLPGFLPGAVVRPQDTSVYYKPWSAVQINLTNYQGRQIRLEFTTADCTRGAHFGYAYVDVNSGCSSPIGNAEYCLGAPNITLSGPAGYQSYSWTMNNFTTYIGNNQNQTITPPPAANTVVAVSVKPFNGFGCPDTIYTTVRVKATPTPKAGNDQVICKGDYAPIGVGPALPGHTYFWTPINVASATTAVNPTVPTNYILHESLDSTGCSANDTVRITPVTVDTSLRVIGNTVFCRGQTISVQLSVNTGYTGIRWFQNGSVIPGANSNVYTVTAPGTYHAVVNNQTCFDTTRDITITSSPPSNVAYNINVDGQCFINNSFQFTNSSTGAGTLTYLWQFGDGGTSTVTSPTHSYVTAGNYNVSLITTNPLGCKDTLKKPVSVYPMPVAAYTVPTPLCMPNNNFTFTNGSTVAAPATMTYQWTFGDGGNTTATSPSHSYITTGTYNTQLIVVTNNGCRDTIAKTVTLNAKPTVAFAPNVTAQCFKNHSFTFTNTSSITTGTITYQWTFGDGGTSTLASPSHSYAVAGTYNVKLIVTSNNGCKDSLTKTVNVYPMPVAGYTVPTPQCQPNNNFTFTNTSAVSAGTLSYQWTFGDGGNTTAASPTHSYATAGTYNTQLIVITNSGCRDTIAKTIALNAKPTVAFTPGVTAQCFKNHSFTFTNTSSITSGTISYQWTFGDGGTSTVASPSHSYAVAGTYNVKVIVTSNNGCKDSLIKTVTVYPMPVVGYTVPTPQCQPNINFTFTNTSTVSAGTLSYQWTFGDGGTSTAVSPTHGYATEGTYNTQLIVVTNNGCRDTIAKTIVMNAKPSVAFTPNVIAQCFKNHSFTFINTSSITTGTISYQWTFGDGGTSTIASPSHSYAVAGTYTVKLIVTSNNGCKDSLIKTVNVYPMPVVGYTVPTPQCQPNINFIFTNTSTVSAGTISYQWTFGDGGTSTATSPTHSYATAGTYNTQLIVITNNGCRDTIAKTIALNAKPTVAFAPNNAAQCLRGNSFTFTNTSSITLGTITYQWAFGDGGTSTTASPSHSYAVAGTYNVKLIVTSNNGCKDSLIKTVDVYAKPTAAFTTSTTTGCFHSNRFTLSNTSSISSGTITYQWSFGDGNTSALPNPTVQYAAAGTYIITLIATSNFGCKDTTTKTVTVYPSSSPAYSMSNAEQCLNGNSFVFTNTSSVSAGTTLTYNWNFGDGGTSTLAAPTHSYATAGTYTVTLIVTTNNGCKDTLVKQAIVNPKPLLSFAPSTTAQCLNGNSFTFTNSSSIASGSMSYSWSFGDGGTSGVASPTHVYAAAGTYTVKLVITSNKGCKDSLSKQVTVYDKPTAGFGINAPSQCLNGNTFAFINSSSIPTGTLSYSWSFGDGATATATNPTHTYTTAGTDTVKLVVSSANGCKDSATKTVTIEPKPVISFNFNSGLQCVTNNSFTFTNTTSISSGTLSYSWSFGDGGTSTAASPTHNYSTFGSYNVKLVVTTDKGCKDSLTKTVVVAPKPAPAFSVNIPAQCVNGNSFTFTNSSSISSGTMTYSWRFGDGGTSTLTTPVHSYALEGSYTVTLIATSNNSCVDSTTKTLTVYAKPSPAFAVTNAGQCVNNNSFTFTNNSTISSGTLSYNWSFGDSGTSSATSPSHVYGATGTYLVKLVATSSNGCKDSITQSVTVQPKPTASLSVNSSSQCLPGNSFTFTNTSSITSGTLNYYWTFGDGGTSTSVSPTHSYSAAGTYVVRMVATSNNGCIDSAKQNVVVSPKPSPAFGVNGASQCLVSNNFTFTNNSSISSGSMSYSWSFGDGGTSTAISPSYVYTAAGTYSVRLIATSSSGCKDSTKQTITVRPKPVMSLAVNTSNQCLPGNNFTFTNTSSVTFGTLSFSWTFGDGGTSTAVSPSHSYAAAGTYTVRLIATSNGGCIDSLKQNVVVSPKPSPAFAVNTSSQCVNGNNFTFSNNSSISSGSMNYRWTFGDGGTSTAINSVHTYAAVGTYVVTLIATSNAGCIDSIKQSVTVNAKPVVALSVNVPNQCLKGNSFAFTNNSSAVGSVSYLWTFGDGGVSTQTSPFHSYSAAGTFTVKLKATSGSGCADSITRTVTVYPDPSLAFTIPNPIQCIKGNSFQFVNGSSISPGSLLYKWDFGDTATTTMTSPSHSYTTAGSFSIKLVATSNNGCKDSLTKTVKVNPNPKAGFRINDTSQCLKNNAYSFVNTTTGNGSTFNSLWSFGDGGTSTAANPSHTYASAGIQQVKLVTTSAEGCKDSITVPVTILNTPSATFNFSTSNQCFTGGNVFVFTNTSGSGSGYSYQWSFGDGTTSVAQSPTHTYPAAGTYPVKLVVTLSGQCKDSIIKSATLYPLPTAAFTNNNPQQCLQGNSFTFINTSLPDTIGTTSKWFFGDGAQSSQTNAVHSYATVGTYVVTLTITSAQGCTHSTSKNVQIDATPVGNLNATTNTICDGDSVRLIAFGGNTYTWYFNGAVIHNQTSGILYATQAGLYTVDVIANQGCKTTVNNNVLLKFVKKPVADFSFAKYCLGMATQFTNTSDYINSLPVTFTWQFSDSFTTSQKDVVHTFAGPSIYNVKLIVASQTCSQLTSEKEATVIVDPLERGRRYPTVNALVSTATQLKARDSAITYKWLPSTFLSNALIQNPVFNSIKEQEYLIQVVKSSGCSVIDTQLVRVFGNMDIFVPSAFSPNNDGSNDRIFPFLVGQGKLIYFKIINRWGVVVFTSNSELPGWDGMFKGTPQPVDGYVWEAEASDYKGNRIRRKGTLTLVR